MEIELSERKKHSTSESEGHSSDVNDKLLDVSTEIQPPELVKPPISYFSIFTALLAHALWGLTPVATVCSRIEVLVFSEQFAALPPNSLENASNVHSHNLYAC
jgi:hypothetical protein